MPFVIDKFKSKSEASVSEEFALFNWSSVGYIWPSNILLSFPYTLTFQNTQYKNIECNVVKTQ